METGIRTLTETDLNTLTTTKQTQFGAEGVTEDGRHFRYVSFGGTSTVAPGLLLVAPAVTTGYQGLAITATTVAGAGQTTATLSAGSTKLVLTNGATAITQDQFAEGYIEVLQTSGSNNGPIVYRIKGNDAAAGSGSPAFAVYLVADEPLRNATVLVAGTDTVNLAVSPFNGVVASATAATPIGVTVSQVVNTASVTNYGWVQRTGLALLTNDAAGNLTVGEGVAQSVTTAGNIVAVGATTIDVGNTRKAFNASTTGPVWLNLA